MNMQNLMAQAQKVQKELEIANSEIENSEFEGNSGGVKVTVSGKMTVNKVEIVDSNLLTDKELLEDMIVVAFNDAFSKIAKMKEDKLGKYTGGLGGLF
jgi:hypothetical protein